MRILNIIFKFYVLYFHSLYKIKFIKIIYISPIFFRNFPIALENYCEIKK